MNTAQKIESAATILARLCEVRDSLDEAVNALTETNALVALDPSGEPDQLAGALENLTKARSTVALEVYRWDTYLDNRE